MGSISKNVQIIQNEHTTWLKQVALNVHAIFWHVPKIIDNSFRTKRNVLQSSKVECRQQKERVTKQQGRVPSAKGTCYKAAR